MKEPFISVIIPCYNSDKFISETLQSLLNQSFKNWEGIIVDDDSNDKSVLVVKEFTKRYPNKFRLAFNPGKGACAARNYGFELSSGNYIQYLDADDILSPDKIEKQVRYLLDSGIDYLASCRWGRFHKSKDDVQWENQDVNKDYSHSNQWLIDSWLGGGMAQTGVWLTHRELIEEAGPWNEELQLNQDGEFFCRVLLASKGIRFVNDCGVYYRSGGVNSISKKDIYSRDKAESLLRSYQLYRENVEACGISPDLKIALGNNFLMFIYQYHSRFPDLSQIAENEFYNLGHCKMWPVGGTRFQQIANVIGFKNSLRLKRFLL